MEENKNYFFDVLKKNEVVMHVKSPGEQINYVKPDDDFDFHAYRLLLLIYVCGRKIDKISKYPILYGRSKFAFYDFLIRYPIYLKKVIYIKNKNELIGKLNLKSYEEESVLAPMIKYLRGPWDKRYDNIFNYMVSKDLIYIKFTNITLSGNKIFCILLTDLGNEIAKNIAIKENEWLSRMQIINDLFKDNTSNELIDKFIGQHFKELIIGGEPI